MATNLEKVLQWIDEDFKFASSENNVLVTRGVLTSSIKIFTYNNEYKIVVGECTDEKLGYLMGFAGSRKPRAGEDWTRGNDIKDGPFSKETWYQILSDIVSYEMVEVAKQKESITTSEAIGV